MASTSVDRVLCLDFANTGGDHPLASDEQLHSYADLVSWGRQNDALSPADAVRLVKAARARPGDAEAALRRAFELREVLYRLFTATARGDSPSGQDLEALNRVLAATRLRLRAARGEPPCCGLEWTGEGDELDRLLWPLVRSAADLLTSRESTRVRECASETCGWLFLDRSRGGRRRWCDMRTCGNRAKARRYYRSHREAGG